ncbi:MAG: hypothetical protein ACKOFX_05835, partial [Solirubrobacterales bacterium]
MRLARNGQGPKLRAFTDSDLIGERPVFNVVAELRPLPIPREAHHEPVVLSADGEAREGLVRRAEDHVRSR